MRILLITQLFQPEPNHLKGLAFAKELIRLGYEVDVLTGFPNYPAGRIYPGYRQRPAYREVIEGVPICRVPVYPSHNSSGFVRSITYASLTINMLLFGLIRIRRPGIVHVYQGPATLVLPALALRLIWGIPYVLDIQDLWPDSVVSSGMLRLPVATSLLGLWSRVTYRYAERIVVLSPGYKKVLADRGVDPAKIEVVYNWADESALNECINTDKVPPEVSAKMLAGGFFRVIYAGNMGPVQALGSVLEAAEIMARRNLTVKLLFLGDGADANELKIKAKSSGIKNVEFISRQSPLLALHLIRSADAVLVHLKNDSLGRIGIPQKTQAYLAAGRPIIMAVKGDAADLVLRARAGVVCEPENPSSIAETIEELFTRPKEDRETLGRNGRSYYEENLSFKAGVDRMNSIFAEIT